MAICHVVVSWTDHKGGTGEARTGEVQKTGLYYVGGGVNDSKIGNMAPRSRGFSITRNKGRKFDIRFHLQGMSPFPSTAYLTQQQTCSVGPTGIDI
jgi:hypothetical protein